MKGLSVNQAHFRDIISGRRKGIMPTALRLGLGITSIPYSLAIRIRNSFYERGIFKTLAVTAPVISVGNITAGGTGKTPLVAWLVKYISPMKPCAILTRGYKAAHHSVDEPSLLARSAPNTPVVVNPDRITGAKEAIANGAEVLILDDAFQHRRIARDLDIVTIDATCPFGYGKILPAGLLRESIGSLKRADVVIITRADQVDKNKIEEIERTIKAIKPSLVIATAAHKPLCIRDSRANESMPEELKGKNVFAFCGIGNPDAFLSTLKSLGANIADSRFFDDHYHYTKSDIEQIAQTAKAANADMVLTTEKDFSKINSAWLAETPVDFAYLVVEIELLSNRRRITELIDKAIAGKITAST